jgi:hypothetical protein
LDVGAVGTASPEDENAAQKAAFDRGDETGDAENALDGGLEFNEPPPEARTITVTDEEKTKRAAKQRRENRDQLIDAVTALSETVVEKAEDSGLRCVDLLRLRAILMILASAGWDGKNPPKNRLQVLPTGGDPKGAWPRLLGKVLFAYFGRQRSAIATLVLEDFYDQISDDILECWASCIWAIQVAIAGASRHRESPNLLRSFENLRTSIYRIIALREEEMEDTRILRILDALSDRFGEGLGCDGPSILADHRRTVTAVAKAKIAQAGAS